MRRAALTLALFALPLITSPGLGQGAQFGVKGIMLLPGEAYVEEFDNYVDIDLSLGAGFMVDTRLGERFLGGLYVDFMQARAQDESGLLMDAGIALKAALGSDQGKVRWRPGIGIGFGHLAEVGSLDASSYLTLRAGVEVVLPGGWLIEGSIYGAPTGGNDDLTISYGPMPMLRFGRLF